MAAEPPVVFRKLCRFVIVCYLYSSAEKILLAVLNYSSSVFSGASAVSDAVFSAPDASSLFFILFVLCHRQIEF